MWNWVKKKVWDSSPPPPAAITLEPEKKDYFDDKTRLDVNKGDYVRMLQTMGTQFNNPMHCENVIHLIPHYNNTTEHWFKAVMTSFFASQKMRSMMIYKSKFWRVQEKKSPQAVALSKFYGSVRTIIFMNKGTTDAEIAQAFENINPMALKSLLSTMGIHSRGNSLSHQVYVKYLCKLLSIRCVFMINLRRPNTDKLYVSPLVSYGNYDDLDNVLKNAKMLKDDGGVDMLWVSNIDDISMEDRQSIYKFMENVEASQPEYRTFAIQDFDKSAPGVQIYEESYLKDAVFPSSLEKAGNLYKGLSEDMMGLTCNDRRYIYNIWVDFLPRLNEKFGVKDDDKRPQECIMVPYDWITRPNISFQMDKEQCKIAKYERPGMNLSNKYDIDKTLGYRTFVCVHNKYDIQPSEAIKMILNEVPKNITDHSDFINAPRTENALEIDATVLEAPPEAPKDEKPTLPPMVLEDPRTLLCIRRVDNFSKLDPVYKFTNSAWNPDTFLKDLPKTSPKLKLLMDKIEELDQNDMAKHNKRFKHFIYSDLTHGYGTTVIASALIAAKRHLIFGKGKNWFLQDTDTLNDFKNKNGFGILTKGAMFSKNPMSIKLRNEILKAYNKRPDNVHGQNVQILIVDKDFKEGIDLCDVKYVHIFEPQEHESYTKQVIGRATRMCGQAGLNFIPNIGWPLDVYVYNTLISEDMKALVNTNTFFQLYINNKGFNMKELTFMSELEKTCMEGAVDQELNFEIHKKLGMLSPSQVRVMFTGKKQGGGGGGDPFEEMFKPFLAIKRNKELKKMMHILKKSGGSWLKSDEPHDYLVKLSKKSALYEEMLRSYSSNPEKFMKQHSSQINKNLESMFSLVKEAHPYEYAKITGGNQPGWQIPRPPLPPQAQAPKPQEPSSPPLPDDGKSEWVDDTAMNSDVGEDYQSDVIENNDPEPEPLDTPDTFLEFREHVNSKYSNHSWATPEVQNNCTKDASQSQTLPTFTPTQDFVRHYFNPNLASVKGMLLWHTVGTGKTCTAIATATTSFVPKGYDILWVTRSSLRSDIDKNMYETVCNLQMRGHVQKNGKVPQDAATRRSIIGPHWRLQTMSHSQFTNMISGKNKGFLQTLFGRSGEEKEDPLEKTLVIVDEAHRLYKPGSESHQAERADMDAFNKAVQNSYQKSGNNSVRLLLMTATPVTDDPMDLIKLLNLFKVDKSLKIPEQIDQFERKYLDKQTGTFTKEGKLMFMEQIAGNISYLNRSNDPSQFSQPRIEQLYAPMSTSNQLEIQEKLIKLGNVYRTHYNELKLLNDMIEKTRKDITQNIKYVSTDVTPLKENLTGFEENKKTVIMKLKDLQKQINAIKKNPVDKNDKSQEAVMLNNCLKKNPKEKDQ